ncbi:hypothetical protein I546_2341 [Mycobacterium kansasii 732]|nr:hypothetical protein I546_2341 [Mycobacterium kansasii 732]
MCESALPAHIGERTSAIAGHGSPRLARAPEVELCADRIQLATKASGRPKVGVTGHPRIERPSAADAAAP